GGEEGLDPHLLEARDGAGGIVRVQGGQDHVPRESGLDRNTAGLGVPDLADHDDVGVGPEHRLEAGGGGEAGLAVNADLVHTVQLVFDRVLDRDDVLGRVVQSLKRRVKGGGFTGAGRTGDQYGAIGLLERLLEAPALLPVHSEVVEGPHGGGL